MQSKPFGRFLLEKEIITEDQLREALEFQEKSGLFLGQLAVKHGLLSEKEVSNIHTYMCTEGGSFAEAALSLHRLTRAQVEKLTAEQRQHYRFIGEILVKLRILTEGKKDRLLADFKKETWGKQTSSRK